MWVNNNTFKTLEIKDTILKMFENKIAFFTGILYKDNLQISCLIISSLFVKYNLNVCVRNLTLI